MPEADGWGHAQGRLVFTKLLARVDAHPEARVFRISLDGVRRTDASFPRESVVELARRYRGHRGFCLIDVQDQDLLDNWDAAASKRDQPILAWRGDDCRVLGPRPSRGNDDIFCLLLNEAGATASAAAKKLGIKLNNASTKLKQLLEQGFVLRREEIAASGGVEYTYYVIR